MNRSSFGLGIELVEQLYSSARSLLSAPGLVSLGLSQFPLSLTAPWLADPSSSAAGPAVVRLGGYGQFEGTTLDASLTGAALAAPVAAWLGIPYASPPVGPARFTIVGDPEPFEGVRPAAAFGRSCVQVGIWSAPIEEGEGEDCLTFNIFRPLATPLQEKLPVLVWIHGGGFQAGNAKSFDGASFVASAKEPLMVVTFQYRLTSLGFLPSELFESAGLLNLGLRDQHQLLRFLQAHIASFGGDPRRITLGGQSAGAHSTGIHYQYVLPDNETLFSQAILQSGGPTARTFPEVRSPLYQRQYETLVREVGCSQESDILSCLRNVDVGVIKSVSADLFKQSEYSITWPFQPVPGGFMLESAGSKRWEESRFNRLPVLTTSTTDEGRAYAPTDLQTTADFQAFLHGTFPGLTREHLSTLARLYADPSLPSSPYRVSPAGTSPQYARVSAALSDSFYVCSSRETAAHVSAAGVRAWKLRWDVADRAAIPEHMGVPHAADTRYAWDAAEVEHPERAHALHAYFVSFVARGDPNAHRYETASVWPRYDEGEGEAGVQVVVKPDGVSVEVDGIRKDACAFWRSIPEAMSH